MAPKKGHLVELQGLKGAAHLNGSFGRLAKHLREEERWVVRLVDPKQKLATVKVKPENLTPAFGVGARVECRNRLVPCLDDIERGTVVRHLHDGIHSTYGVRLDSGGYRTCARQEYSIESSMSPPIAVDFPVGSQVECKFEGETCEWESGMVMKCNKDWMKNGSPPYLIRFAESYRYFWGTKCNMRIDTAGAQQLDTCCCHKELTCKLRFGVGDRGAFAYLTFDVRCCN